MTSLLEVIEFFDQSRRSVLQRVPPHGSIGIQQGSQLIVQKHQQAVFWNGKPFDAFGPGRHTITPASLPLLMQAASSAWQDNPPETPVYFIGTQPFADQQWFAEVDFQDEEHGTVELRAAGRFSFQIVDARKFLASFHGERELVSSSDALNQLLRPVVAQAVAEALQESCSGLKQLSSKLLKVTSHARQRIQETLARRGVKLLDFYVSSIILPDHIRSVVKAHQEPGAVELADFLRQTVSSAGQTQADPRSVVQAAVSKAGWALDDSAPQWVVEIPIDALRKQKVTVDFDGTDTGGHPLVHFSSTCGPVQEQKAMMYLQFNSQMDYGAFAIKPTEAGEVLVVQLNQLAQTMDEFGATRALGSIALQADRMEEQLMLVDTF